MDKSKQARQQQIISTSGDNKPTAANTKVMSFFEFWPTWLMYLPVGIMWCVWAVRYRSFTLPLIANPKIYLAGMVGGSKAELMSQATGKCKKAILPWLKITKTNESITKQVTDALLLLEQHRILLPFVCKPDTGCRGVGVKLIKDVMSFTNTLSQYPQGAGIILQQLSRYSDEVGIFYVRDPQSSSGEVVSMTFKQRPEVIGDGIHTVAELVLKDARAARLLSLYATRNQSVWHCILPKGHKHSLLFSASHCRGAIFVDAKDHITPQLNQAIKLIMQDLPEFNYGRMDVKYRDLTALENGEHLEIVEINGASSESIHIWDKNARLFDAFKALLWQYKTLFAIGHQVRKTGKRPPSVMSLLKAWRYEKKLSASYPEND